MKGGHLEFLIEEPSMEAFLGVLLSRLFPDSAFRSRSFVKFRDALLEATA